VSYELGCVICEVDFVTRNGGTNDHTVVLLLFNPKGMQYKFPSVICLHDQTLQWEWNRCYLFRFLFETEILGALGESTLLSSALVVLPLYPDISRAHFDPPACNSLSGRELKWDITTHGTPFLPSSFGSVAGNTGGLLPVGY